MGMFTPCMGIAKKKSDWMPKSKAMLFKKFLAIQEILASFAKFFFYLSNLALM